VAPLLHGLVLLITDDPMVSAWIPAVAAYAALGLLAAALARELWPGQLAAWIAALLCWSTPLYARLAAGGFIDTLGACASVACVWLLLRSLRTLRMRDAILAGAVMALAFFTRYDYGLLLLVALAATLGLVVLRGPKAHAKPLVIAGVTALVLAELWFIPDASAKWTGFGAFLRGNVGSGVGGAPGITLETWLYYVGALWFNPELGLSSLVADITLIAVVVGAVYSLRMPSLILPVLYLAIWYVFYSIAGARSPQFARYMATALPFAFVLVGIGVARAIGPLQGSLSNTRVRTAATWLAAAVIGLEMVRQLAGPAGFGHKFWFLSPNPATEAVVDLLAANLGHEHSSLLMVGDSNEVSPDLVRLVWMRQIGRAGQRVISASEASLGSTELVLAVRAADGSLLATPDYLMRIAGKQPYFDSLERSGQYVRMDRLVAEDGRLEATLWRALR
jgi:4-amino-4-deoxy-L-arabinose transferase-like glycosyltransferase